MNIENKTLGVIIGDIVGKAVQVMIGQRDLNLLDKLLGEVFQDKKK